MFWDKKTPEERKSAKNSKKILKKIEIYFGFEKNSLVRSRMPTERLVKVVCNGCSNTKESKVDFLQLLGMNPEDKSNMQKLENFLQNLK